MPITLDTLVYSLVLATEHSAEHFPSTDVTQESQTRNIEEM